MKKTICGLLAAFMLLGGLSAYTMPVQAAGRLQMTLKYNGKEVAYNDYAIDLFVNGFPLTDLPQEPVLIDNRTYVPVREVFESLGATVQWNGAQQQIFIAYGDSLILLEIGSRIMRVDGRSYEIEVAPLIVNNKTMVPVRFAAEALQFSVVADFKGEQRSVFIDTPGNAPAQTVPPVATQPPTVAPPAGDLEVAVDMSTTVIEPMEYATTNITGVMQPAAGAPEVYTIRASSEISRVEKMLLHDNRLVIDIYNSEITMHNKTLEIADNPVLASIRAAQNQIAPERITRVVFDIASPVRFTVSITPDRRGIEVALDTEARMSDVTSVSFASDGVSDYIYLEGAAAPAVSLFTLTNNDRLVIDMPMSRLDSLQEQNVNGVFAYALRTGQFDADTARVVLDLRGITNYEVSTEGNRTVVRLTEATVRNVNYDERQNLIVIDKAGTALKASDILHKDEYLQYRYTFTLPGDYSGSLGYGDHHVNDGMVNSFTVRSANGMTEIVVSESRILAFDVTEDAQNIYIRAMLPSEKYERIVVIDPGHGGGAPGTSGFGITEKNVNLSIGLKVVALLEADPRVKVYATRLEDVNPSLAERAKFANGVGDLFVSIHHNAVENRQTVSGTETHYYPHDNDNEMGITSKAVAEIMQRNLIAGLGFIDRKTIKSDFQVLRETTVPAVLLELGFLTNQAENAIIGTQAYELQAAQAIYSGIMEVMSTYRPAR